MDFRNIFVGESVPVVEQPSKLIELTDVFDYVLEKHIDDIALAILEPLEIHKQSNIAQYHVFVRARLSEDDCTQVGTRFINLFQTLFKEEASISRSRYLYFGDEIGGNHEIFDGEDSLDAAFPLRDLSVWQKTTAAPLGWNYAILEKSTKDEIDQKFEKYRNGQIELFKSILGPTSTSENPLFLHNLLIPAAFRSKGEFERSKRALGAIFLVIISKKRIPPDVLEVLFLRLSLFMYYFHSAEAIDTLIIESGLDRYQRLLTMLENPLDRLTTALSEVERDAQELRAILYEPSRGLLASRRRIADFFRDGELLKTPDGVGVKIKHTPKNITDIRDAQWTLAFLLASIRGDKPKIPSSRESLTFELVLFLEALKNDKNLFHGLAKSVDRLLHVGLDEWSADGFKLVNKVDAIVRSLIIFKSTLFEVLKPDYQQSLKKLHLYRLLGIGQKPDLEDGKRCIVPKLGDPFSTFAHLFEFFGMIFEQHPDYNSSIGPSGFLISVAGCKCDGVSSACCPITTISAPNEPWLRSDSGKALDLESIRNKWLMALSRKSSGDLEKHREVGNFNGCFEYLFSRVSCPPSINITETGIKIRWDTISLVFEGKDLRVEIINPKKP